MAALIDSQGEMRKAKAWRATGTEAPTLTHFFPNLCWGWPKSWKSPFPVLFWLSSPLCYSLPWPQWHLLVYKARWPLRTNNNQEPIALSEPHELCKCYMLLWISKAQEWVETAKLSQDCSLLCLSNLKSTKTHPKGRVLIFSLPHE